MGMKKHAVMVCTKEMRHASEGFIQNPSAVNFLTVTACMHALQYAQQSNDGEISQLLTGKTSDMIVEVLDRKMCADIAELEAKVEAGSARMVDIRSTRERVS